MGVTIGEYCTAMMKRRGCYISWCFQFLQIVDEVSGYKEGVAILRRRQRPQGPKGLVLPTSKIEGLFGGGFLAKDVLSFLHDAWPRRGTACGGGCGPHDGRVGACWTADWYTSARTSSCSLASPLAESGSVLDRSSGLAIIRCAHTCGSGS
jgi:hypothetical protein